MSGGVSKEPLAYAKIATKGDVIPPFYITDQYVKEWEGDEGARVPKVVEVVLGRSPQPGSGNNSAFDADFYIGNRMKISKRHAKIYWDYDSQTFQIKSICKNNVKVNNVVYTGSADCLNGQSCELKSQAVINIADGTPLYFLLPKGKPTVDKPKLTYEQLVASILVDDKELKFLEIIQMIQQKYHYYSDESLGAHHSWKTSLRTTLSNKSKTFKKFNKVDPDTGKKSMYWAIKTPEDIRLEAEGVMQAVDDETGGGGDGDMGGVGDDESAEMEDASATA